MSELTATAKVAGVSVSESLPSFTAKSDVRDVLNRLNQLANLKHVRISQSAIDNIRKAVVDKETAAKEAMYAAAVTAFEDLKDATPVYTGATRAAWRFDYSESPGKIHFTVSNSNKKQIARLNYGTRPHVIRPRNRAALKFIIGGRTVFAKQVNHPGTSALGFVDRTRNHLKRNIRSIGRSL